MAQSRPRTVLFLCAAGDQRGADAVSAFDAVAVKMGLPWRGRRLEPGQLGEADLEAAAVVVSLDEVLCRPVLRERFAGWAERVRYWHADAAVESEAMGLVAVLLGGKAEAPEPPAAAEPQKKKPADRPVVRVGRETKGRRGKGVTIISDLPLGASEIEKLAARLKQKCGTGGTVRDGVIEIQGDHRDRLVGELESLGYRVKRVGG